MCYGFDTMDISMKLTAVCAQQMVIEIHSCVLHVVTDNRGTLLQSWAQSDDQVLLVAQSLC